jgi:hypothetical protein
MDPAKMLELFFTVKYKKIPEKVITFIVVDLRRNHSTDIFKLGCLHYTNFQGASPLLHQASGVKQTDSSYTQATFEERSPHKSRKLDQNDSPRGSRLKTVEIARGGSMYAICFQPRKAPLLITFICRIRILHVIRNFFLITVGSLEKDPQAQFPASYYTLTEAEMQEHNYPLSAYDDGNLFLYFECMCTSIFPWT